MSQAVISIVIPCYNDGAFLEEAVGSVRALPSERLEFVVVDDGSTDLATIRLLERLEASGVRILRQANGGLARARNAGIAATSGEYVIPLDSDNRLRPAMIEHCRRVLDARPGVGVVYGDVQEFGERAGRRAVGPFERYRLLHWNYLDACAGFRRTVWERNGGYDAAMPVQGLEDWDFWLGAVEQGWEFSYVPEILFDYRVRPGSMITRALPHQARLERYVASKHPGLYRDAFIQLLIDRNSIRSQAGLMLRTLRRRVLGQPTTLS
jgi:glycosyltransferase involved in cell wall biosynthesis